MATMNPAYNQFVTLAAQDGILFSVGMVRTAKRIADRWFWGLIFVLLIVPMIIMAQLVPFVFRKHLRVIFPALPDIKDRETLRWLKDVFLLYFYTLKGYRPFCVFRKSLDGLLNDLDEHIDSLSFALENPNALSQALANAESSKRPASL